MKHRVFCLVICLLLILTLSTPSGAVWWLFGRQDMPPQVSNVYIGSARGIDIDEQLLITSDSLVDGKLVIRGTAYSQKSPIAKVLVSVNGGETWDTATIAKPGNRVSFIYEFEPKLGFEYEVAFQAFDLQDMESEIWDAGYYSVMVSGLSIDQVLTSILQNMAMAYSNADINGFMKYVSEGFDGGPDIMENALISDFDTYVDTSVQFSVYAVNSGRTGYEAVVDWTQYLTERDSGRRIERNGTSSLHFTAANTLAGMRGDVLFGFTSKRIGEQSGTEYSPSMGDVGRVTLVSKDDLCQGFRFSTQEVIRDLTWESEDVFDMMLEHGEFFFVPNRVACLWDGSFNDVTEPPDPSDVFYEGGFPAEEGLVAVVICEGNTWAVIEIEDAESTEELIDEDYTFTSTVTFKYRYFDTEVDFDFDFQHWH